jgi:membrane-associated HD superfamily phosphohydrolase
MQTQDKSKSPGQAPKPQEGFLREKAEARAAWLGISGPLIGVILLFVFVEGYADEANQETALLHGGLLGLGVATVLGLSLALWTAKTRKKTANPLLPMAMGFLLKLIFLGLGMFLLARPFKELGSFEAYGLGFIFGAFSYQLLFAFLARPRIQRATG